MLIVVDGNDGTGKSTLVAALRARGFVVQDRGVPTRMTDDPGLVPEDDGSIYVLLDVPVEVSQDRLHRAGKDLTERYHTTADLTHYRGAFRDVFVRLRQSFGPQRVIWIDASDSAEELLQRVLSLLSVV